MLAIGKVIWISVRPLLRLVICTSFGFIVTKAGIFPLEAARGAGQVMLNILLPSLLFSKIIPAFTPQNAGALGPLILVCVFYEASGILMAWLVKQFFWVPHRFRYGILVAGGWGNYGDIPTSVLMSITGSAPFNGASDQNLSVAYLAAFLLIFCVTLFPMGGHRLIAMDYAGPEIDDAELRMPMFQKLKESISSWRQYVSRILAREHQEHVDVDSEITQDSEPPADPEGEENVASLAFSEPTLDDKRISQGDAIQNLPMALSRQNTRTTQFSFQCAQTSKRMSNVESVSAKSMALDDERAGPCRNDLLSLNKMQSDDEKRDDKQLSLAIVNPCPDRAKTPSTIAVRSPRSHRILKRLYAILKSFMIPPTLSILTAFPIALIQPLKALFTPIPNSPIPNAPDGQPPLAFILDAASFIGAASVPVSLICLGSALARLHIPRQNWGTLPVGAIAWLAIGKMLVMPVVGVAFTQALVSAGIIDAEDKVLRIVCIFMSCVPTATTQVFLTQVYSDTGRADHVSAFLVPQYAIMLLSMTALIAYSLSLLF
ncbi:auxin efflux carrier [Schizopora paradoxa]|uniref:Auxin efflux carrier n=1 Tax=Schizopora paradoxa TaxID=27342 RepID=A0A0H2RWL8_9AGAM|nr:auxin efflux carrier [Schizopora paradoxa]